MRASNTSSATDGECCCSLERGAMTMWRGALGREHATLALGRSPKLQGVPAVVAGRGDRGAVCLPRFNLLSRLPKAAKCLQLRQSSAESSKLKARARADEPARHCCEDDGSICWWTRSRANAIDILGGGCMP